MLTLYTPCGTTQYEYWQLVSSPKNRVLELRRRDRAVAAAVVVEVAVDV